LLGQSLHFPFVNSLNLLAGNQESSIYSMAMTSKSSLRQ